MGDWTYLTKHDMRSISPIAEFIEKHKPFYVTSEAKFFEVQDIRVDSDNTLVFILQDTSATNIWNMN